MSELELRVKRLNKATALPAYAYAGDAGLDLCAATSVDIAPFQRVLIPTGLSIAIPEGFAGFVLPRSGLALTRGLSLVNAPGLVDSHYRGEVKILALNTDSQQPIKIEAGERIAQLVVLEVATPSVIEVEELDTTSRGSGGFGSSGL
ncbi:MAG: dUTP diphosphatase [Coriobacteriales bacterium]|nr:dUTP diphosphatase [Coriobacteriales bacterium]